MRSQSIAGLLMGLVLVGCGSSGTAPTDTRPISRPDAYIGEVDTSVANPPAVDGGVLPIGDPDAGCDEDAMGEHYCIINHPGGNPTEITRQTPVPYQSCKQ